MDNLFEVASQKIRIYIGRETVDDPYEKNVTVSMLNPVPISAIVSDLVFSQINWKMPGIVTDKAKQLIIKKRHKNLLQKSQKIQVVGETEYYEGWRQNGKLQFRQEGDFLRCYIYVKKS